MFVKELFSFMITYSNIACQYEQIFSFLISYFYLYTINKQGLYPFKCVKKLEGIILCFFFEKILRASPQTPQRTLRNPQKKDFIDKQKTAA